MYCPKKFCATLQNLAYSWNRFPKRVDFFGESAIMINICYCFVTVAVQSGHNEKGVADDERTYKEKPP